MPAGAFAVAWLVVGTGAGAWPTHARADVPAVCGNAVVEPPETCDDGNLIDGDGCSALCQIENAPPDCSTAEASTTVLWPPNHKLVDVTVGGVVDPDGDPVRVAITAVAQDESLGSDACPDAVGLGDDSVSLRAEREGSGDGRVYHVAFAADDGRGGTCTGAVEVCVLHDHRPGGACGDQGPLIDSTAGGAPECDGSCEPATCVPDPDDLSPPECDDDALPGSIEHRAARARAILARAARRGPSGARRLAAKAARILHRAAVSGARDARMRRVSDSCVEAVQRRLENAETCARCAAGDD